MTEKKEKKPRVKRFKVEEGDELDLLITADIEANFKNLNDCLKYHVTRSLKSGKDDFDELQNKYLRAKIKNVELKNRQMERAESFETKFGVPVSNAGKKAIKVGLDQNIYGEGGVIPTKKETEFGEKTVTPKEQQEEEQKELDIGKTRAWIDNNWIKFVRYRKQVKEGWKISCEFNKDKINECDVTFIQLPSEQEAEKRLKEHLLDSHDKDIWELIREYV